MKINLYQSISIIILASLLTGCDSDNNHVHEEGEECCGTEGECCQWKSVSSGEDTSAPESKEEQVGQTVDKLLDYSENGTEIKNENLLDQKPHIIADLDYRLLWCNPGSFKMGSPVDEIERQDKFETQHEVTLTKGFWLGEYTISQSQWSKLMDPIKVRFEGEDLPIDSINWYQAKGFCDKLNEIEKNKLPKGYSFSLPTEAQWEYACRAGTNTAFAFGEFITADNANTYSSGGPRDELGRKTITGTVKAGSYKPNAWGFHDMHGNVFEWCFDYFQAHKAISVTDPLVPKSQFLSRRVIKGGNWRTGPEDARSAYRKGDSMTKAWENQGFRVCLRSVE